MKYIPMPFVMIMILGFVILGMSVYIAVEISIWKSTPLVLGGLMGIGIGIELTRAHWRGDL